MMRKILDKARDENQKLKAGEKRYTNFTPGLRHKVGNLSLHLTIMASSIRKISKYRWYF